MPTENYNVLLKAVEGMRSTPKPQFATQSPLLDLLRGVPPKTPKPKVFVSYHHAYDEPFADRFGRLFHDNYDVVTDRSLSERIDSEDADYVYQRIREEFITGTSCTIVLCGRETMNRKHVDWEIKATLDKGHAMLGVILPSLRPSANGEFVVPDRLYENVISGYAHWIHWTDNALEVLGAIQRARFMNERSRIRNSAPMLARNRPGALASLLSQWATRQHAAGSALPQR